MRQNSDKIRSVRCAMKHPVRACYLLASLTIAIFLISTVIPVIVIATPIIAVSGTQNAGGVVIKEWEVPTPNSRPHDPAVAPDGSLWYTAQMANRLGRFDPKTERFKEFPLKTADSGPHGLAADQEGNIWFTAISKGYVGKLN